MRGSWWDHLAGDRPTTLLAGGPGTGRTCSWWSSARGRPVGAGDPSPPAQNERGASDRELPTVRPGRHRAGARWAVPAAEIRTPASPDRQRTGGDRILRSVGHTAG